MNDNVAKQLADFSSRMREKTEQINAAKGKEAEKLQSELDLFIGQKMGELMSQGISVGEIQKALRAATDIVPQTYAPDDDREAEEHGEGSEIYETLYFLPMEDKVIADFSAGKMNSKKMTELLRKSEDAVGLELVVGLDLVLTDYGRDTSIDISGGEVVAGSGGEAFMPESLTVKGSDGPFSVDEPMVFKTSEEVRSICARLGPVTEKAFLKAADIKKLVKAGWLEGYDAGSVKEEGDWIIGEMWEEFLRLRDIYRIAAEKKQGIVIFAGYTVGDEE